jgi:glutamate dehydrogenase (NAD(P)+)
MLAKVVPLLDAWDAEGITPRTTALGLADWQHESNVAAEAAGQNLLRIP